MKQSSDKVGLKQSAASRAGRQAEPAQRTLIDSPEAALIALQGSAGNAAVSGILHGGGDPLDARTRAAMEATFGTDFGGVRVHTGVNDADRARTLGTNAYTVGNDITFAHGRYDPSSQSGRGLLAHELAHVVQQRRGVTRGDQSPPTATAEGDARAAAHAATHGETVTVSTTTGVGIARDGGPPPKPKMTKVEAAIELFRRARGHAAAGEHDRAKKILASLDEFLRPITTPSHVDKCFAGLNGMSMTAARMFVAGSVGAVDRMIKEYRSVSNPSLGQWDYQLQNFAIGKEWLEVLAGDRTLEGARTIQAYEEGTTTMMTIALVLVAAPIVVAAGVQLGAALLATEAGMWVLTMSALHPEVAASLTALAIGKVLEFAYTGKITLSLEETIQIVFDIGTIRYSGYGKVRSNNGSHIEVEVTVPPTPKGGGGAVGAKPPTAPPPVAARPPSANVAPPPAATSRPPATGAAAPPPVAAKPQMPAKPPAASTATATPPAAPAPAQPAAKPAAPLAGKAPAAKPETTAPSTPPASKPVTPAAPAAKATGAPAAEEAPPAKAGVAAEATDAPPAKSAESKKPAGTSAADTAEAESKGPKPQAAPASAPGKLQELEQQRAAFNTEIAAVEKELGSKEGRVGQLSGQLRNAKGSERERLAADLATARAERDALQDKRNRLLAKRDAVHNQINATNKAGEGTPQEKGLRFEVESIASHGMPKNDAKHKTSFPGPEAPDGMRQPDHMPKPDGKGGWETAKTPAEAELIADSKVLDKNISLTQQIRGFVELASKTRLKVLLFLTPAGSQISPTVQEFANGYGVSIQQMTR